MWMIPIILSIVVLAAHFLREGSLTASLCLLSLLPLLALHYRWIARLVQGVLFFGVIRWMLTIAELVRFRAATGQPYTRMMIILAVVALITAISALLFQTRRAQTRYFATPFTHTPSRTP
jgi:hypothetical protein